MAANLFTRLGLMLFSVVDVDEEDATLVALLVLFDDVRFSKLSDISEINILVKVSVDDSLVVMVVVVGVVEVSVLFSLVVVKFLLIPFDMETDFRGSGCGFDGKSNIQNYQKIKYNRKSKGKRNERRVRISCGHAFNVNERKYFVFYFSSSFQELTHSV